MLSVQCQYTVLFHARGPALRHATGGTAKDCGSAHRRNYGSALPQAQCALCAGRSPFPQVPSMAPAPGPAPGPVQGPASGPGASPGSSGGSSDGYSSSGSYSDSGDYGGSLSSSAGGGSTASEPDFTVYPEAPVTAPTGLQVTGLGNTAFMSLT